ncbi:MAG: c-type heme family protein [Planctomycetota bacterium]
MTIRKKFILVFAIVLSATLTGAFFVFKMTSNQDTSKAILNFFKITNVQDTEKPLTRTTNSAVVNLSERQRMLIQKYTKEYINELIPLQVRHSTLKAAEIATLQITEYRKQYANNVIGKLKKEVPAVHPNRNYAVINSSIPLPTTLLKETSDAINQKGIYSYDLLSKWNINKEKGLTTDFENEAFNYLYNKNGKVFSRFLVHKGRYTLRYATPDIDSAGTCANCHNVHKDSPKSDFKPGEVMGILVVNIPVGTVNARTEALLAGSDNKKFGTDSFLKTKRAFDTTLNALINGGKAPLDLEMTRFTTLPPTQDSKIRSKLYEVKRSWNIVQENMQKLKEVDPYSVEYIAAYDDAYISANTAMKAMNEAVHMYPIYPAKLEAKTKMATLWWVQGGSVGVIILIITLGWLFFNETRERPLYGSDPITFATERTSEQVSAVTPKKKRHNAYTFNKEASLASLRKLMKTGRY